MTTDEQWQIDRRSYGLPDTREARTAFYAGGRHVLGRVTNAFVGLTLVDDLRPVLLTLNDELRSFARRTMGL